MNKAKEIRNQIRNVLKEELATIVNEELFKLLEAKISARLDLVTKNVQNTMHEMNDRQKSTLSYLVRSTTTPNE